MSTDQKHAYDGIWLHSFRFASFRSHAYSVQKTASWKGMQLLILLSHTHNIASTLWWSNFSCHCPRSTSYHILPQAPEVHKKHKGGASIAVQTLPRRVHHIMICCLIESFGPQRPTDLWYTHKGWAVSEGPAFAGEAEGCSQYGSWGWVISKTFAVFSYWHTLILWRYAKILISYLKFVYT